MKTKRFFLPVLFLFLAIGFTACEADDVNDKINTIEEFENPEFYQIEPEEVEDPDDRGN